MGSRACVVPFFHIDPKTNKNKGLGDEEELPEPAIGMLAQAPRTPSPSPEPVAPVPVRTGTRSWDIRNRKRQWAAWGYTEPLAKAQIYNARKNERANARKEWVLQHGYLIPVPQSLWPKYPSGEYRPWVPPKHLLTLEQEAQPMCAKYMEQLELIEAAAAEAAPLGFGVEEEEVVAAAEVPLPTPPWRMRRSSGSRGSGV